MARIHLYGHLAEHFAPHYDLQVSGPAEAVRALVTTLPEFRSKLLEADYQVIVGDLDNGLELSEQDLVLKTTKDIHLIPVMQGAGNGRATGLLILSAALLAVSFLLPGAAPFTEGARWYVTLAANAAIAVGLQGISALLSPQAKDDDDKNGIFANSTGTTRQGEPVPLIYGQVYTTFEPISANIVGEDTIRTTGNSTYNSDIGGWETTS